MSIYRRYGTSLKREEYRVSNHEFGDSEMNVEKTIEVGGIIREYINVFNGKEKTQSLYWRTLDPVTLTPSKDKTKVDSRSGKDYKSGGFQVLSAYSPDRSKLLIVTRAPENRGDGYLFEVYDQNFNLIWDMIPKLSLDDHELSLNLTVAYKSDLVNLQVDNDGFAYCLGGYYETVGDHREEVSLV